MQPTGNSVVSSRDLKTRVNSVLRECGRPEMKRVSIEVEGRRVILYGQVATYYAKQVAQTLAGDVSGVEDISNQIDVDHRMPSLRIT